MPRHDRHEPRARRAFTLIELLVALVLLDCGLLAIVGCGAVVVRATRTSTLRTDAIAAGQSRLEHLVASTCASVATGSVRTARSRESWSVVRDTSGLTRDLHVTVDYTDGTMWRSLSLQSRAPC